MNSKDVKNILSKFLIGAAVSSIKLAGPELELVFVGVKVAGVRSVSIDTDAWIFVGEDKEIDASKISDDSFFSARREAILALYDLTGYEVEDVDVYANGWLALKVCQSNVAICPVDLFPDSTAEKDSWVVSIEQEDGAYCKCVGFYQGQGFSGVSAEPT